MSEPATTTSSTASNNGIPAVMTSFNEPLNSHPITAGAAAASPMTSSLTTTTTNAAPSVGSIVGKSAENAKKETKDGQTSLKDPRIPWMVLFDTTIDLIKWHLAFIAIDPDPIAEDELNSMLDDFEVGRTQLTDLHRTGNKMWSTETSIRWARQVIACLDHSFLAGYVASVEAVTDDEHDPEATELGRKYFKLTQTYLEILESLILSTLRRLKEKQRLVDTDRATQAAANKAGITLTETEYDQVAAKKNVANYCALQYELWHYFGIYYLIIEAIHEEDYNHAFEILKSSLEFWLRYCLYIMHMKDHYCLKTRQVILDIMSLLLQPENDHTIQFVFNGHDDLIDALVSTVWVLLADTGLAGGEERPGLCDVICSGSKRFGRSLKPNPESDQKSNGHVGIALMHTLLQIQGGGTPPTSKEPMITSHAYSPIVPFVDRLCSGIFKLVSDDVNVVDQDIPIQVQMSGFNLSKSPRVTIGRLDLYAAVTMQRMILCDSESGYYGQDPTRLIPVFTQLLRILENRQMDLSIRGQIAHTLAQAIASLPNETASLIYEQYHLLYPSDTTIPNGKRLPIIHRLMTILSSELILSDPIEKYYPPFYEFFSLLQWPITRCARLIPMKELIRNAAVPKQQLTIVPSLSSSNDHERKVNDAVGPNPANIISPTSSKPFDVNGEPRNIIVWLMDIIELFITNDPRIRSDGLPNPLAPDATIGDVWGDRWQLHPYDYDLVDRLMVTIRALIDATPDATDPINNETARRYWSPVLPRLFPLLLTIQELLPPHKMAIKPIKFSCLGLMDDLIRFIPRNLLIEKNHWIRLQRISDKLLATPTTMNSQVEVDATLDLKELIHVGRQEVYERCLQTSRWIPSQLATDLAKQTTPLQRRVDESKQLRMLYAERIHHLRSTMIRIHGRLLETLWSDYDASLKSKLFPHLFRVLPADYGRLSKTEVAQMPPNAVRIDRGEACHSAVTNDQNAAAGGADEEPESDDDDADESQEDEEEDEEEEEDDDMTIHSLFSAARERSSALHVFTQLFAQVPFIHSDATEKMDELYDSVWSQIIINRSEYGNEPDESLASLIKYLPLIKPMALEQKWRPGEISILLPKLQQQLTENVNLGIELFKTSTDIRVIQNVLVGWSELLKGYGLAALGEGNDPSTETINRRESELISYAMIIIRFAHPCQHDFETTEPEGFDEDTWRQRLSAMDNDYDADEKKAGLEHWRSKIATQFHAKVHLHGSCCSDWDCYYDDLVNLAHHCCEFLAHLARARGSSFETRHKRVWKHLSYSAEKIPWRGALGCYWTGVAESLGSEGFDTYKVDVFEYMLTNLTIKESQGLFLGQSAYCLGNIFMHIDLPRIQSYLPRTLDALIQAHGYAQRKLDAHYKAMSDGTHYGLCDSGVELQSWFQCQDGITIALGKILMVASSHPAVSSRMDELLKVFLSGLPLKVLIDDQKVVYSAVIKLINTFPLQHPGMIEPYYPRILFIFATVLDLNLGQHRILPQLEKFILMGAKSILKQHPQLRQTVLVDEWKEMESGKFSLRFCERVDGKSISSTIPPL